MKAQNSKLSIIILNYNTGKVTTDAISSIEKCYPKETTSGEYQIIVADNASSDESLTQFLAYKKTSHIKYLDIVDNKKNLGFAAGNNSAYQQATGEYLLFINPDTVMHTKTIPVLLDFLETHPHAGIVTCKVEIPGGKIDEACHRGFPTPWNAFCHFFLRADRLFPKSKLFAGYTQGWKDFSSIHTVDACSGAFMLMRRNVFEEVGRWDEDYFFYGEDLSLCYEVKEKGYDVYYIPTVSILHYGGVSSGIKKQSSDITTANIKTKTLVQNARFDAMRIFYNKHYKNKYPYIITWLVNTGIDILHKRNLPKSV